MGAQLAKTLEHIVPACGLRPNREVVEATAAEPTEVAEVAQALEAAEAVEAVEAAAFGLDPSGSARERSPEQRALQRVPRQHTKLTA